MPSLSMKLLEVPSVQEIPDPPLMVITPERLAYLGLLGSPKTRVFGAVTLYASIGKPFTLCQGGVEETAMFAIVPPYRPHQISASDPTLIQILLEAETVQSDLFPARLSKHRAQEVIDKFLDGFRAIRLNAGVSLPFDALFFDRLPKARSMDSRISKIIQKIVADPAKRHPAASYADELALSHSRFTHLFRQETGSNLRQYRAWKRARGVMALVTNKENLVEVALSAGFADSTHFSHSVRHFFGLQPRDIFSGSRNLNLVLQLATAHSAEGAFAQFNSRLVQ